jgi:2-polyprenyl-3-methyl-5-hydroxy-6-metoxy-1,4-benzoquinol methylase
MTVKEHYDNHLGKYYSWMAGDFMEKQVEHQRYFEKHDLKPFQNKHAMDLGCGHGIQAIALASLGYNVKAVDFNTTLLAELDLHRGDLPVEIVSSDIQNFLETESTKAELIVCMGDTLTHLPSADSVELLFKRAQALLIPKGKFIVSFRDLTIELKGNSRFITVKTDDDKIFTCFLEYFQGHVMVHDIVHEKEQGKWIQKVSAFPKLRINEKMITDMAKRNQLTCISSEIINRMIHLIFENTTESTA